jgi:seryl-tRNA synthetase
VGEKRAGEVEGRVREAEERAEKVEAEMQGLKAKIGKAEKEVKEARGLVKEKEEERKSAQGELDDMLEVFGDLEEKITKYKVSARVIVLVPVGVWCRWANGSFRNGLRHWDRRCRMVKTKMGTMTMMMKTRMKTRMRRKMINKGGHLFTITIGQFLNLPGLQKQVRLMMCILAGT